MVATYYEKLQILRPKDPDPLQETEHLMKALLEQPNGLARRIVSKAGGNPTALLDAVDAFTRRQPRVSGDSQQVPSCRSS